jgi:hypothetical protein
MASLLKEAFQVGGLMKVTPSRHSRRRQRMPSGRAKPTDPGDFKVRLNNRELPEGLGKMRGNMVTGFRVMLGDAVCDWTYEETDMNYKTDYMKTNAPPMTVEHAGIRGRTAGERTASWAPWG